MVHTNPSLQAKSDKKQVIMLMPIFTENSHLPSAGSSSTGSDYPSKLVIITFLFTIKFIDCDKKHFFKKHIEKDIL